MSKIAALGHVVVRGPLDEWRRFSAALRESIRLADVEWESTLVAARSDRRVR